MRTASSLIAAALALVFVNSALADRTYRWVDEHGVVHFGDRVPPEYAGQRSDVLNRQGVAVGEREGRRTDADREAQHRQAEEAARQQDRQRRDRVLLATYLSVEEIRMLRDRRLELLQAQVTVTEQNVERLQRRLELLESRAQVYAPYNDAPGAPELPTELAEDIADAAAALAVYRRSLDHGRTDMQRLTEQFAQDIARFEELRGDGTATR